jgi:YVTN family beta-propeller protein
VETVSLFEPPKTGIKASGERLFVANTSTNRVTFIESNNIITRVVPSGPSPRWFAWDEERDRIYVTNHGDRTVTVLDPVGERVVNVITVGKKPYAAVLIHR